MAYCAECGSALAEGAPYCSVCHRPTGLVQPPYASPSQPAAPVMVRQAPPQPVIYPPPYPSTYPSPYGSSFGPPKRSMLAPILGTIAVIFVLVVGVLIWIVTQSNKEDAAKANAQKEAIRQVLERDDELSARFKKETENFKLNTESDLNEYAVLIQGVADAEKQNDTSSCPRDFAEAYAKNATAWAEFAGAFKAHPHIPTEGEAFLRGLLKGLNGDTSSSGEFDAEAAAWLSDIEAKDKEVKATWKDVETLKAQYGVAP